MIGTFGLNWNEWNELERLERTGHNVDRANPKNVEK